MSIFGNFGRRMVAAQEKRARRMVHQHLMNMDEATLKQAGFDRATLRREYRSL